MPQICCPPQTHKILVSSNILGCLFRKTFFPFKNHTSSFLEQSIIESHLVNGSVLVIHFEVFPFTFVTFENHFQLILSNGQFGCVVTTSEFIKNNFHFFSRKIFSVRKCGKNSKNFQSPTSFTFSKNFLRKSRWLLT